MGGILTEIINILVDGIEGVAGGIGTGLSSLVQQIFLSGGVDGEPYTLSVFGGLIVVFAGISLAIGLSRFVVNWVTSFGN